MNTKSFLMGVDMWMCFQGGMDNQVQVKRIASYAVYSGISPVFLKHFDQGQNSREIK